MLVYVRDADREKILKEVSVEEIPQHLKVRFDEENKINQKLDEDQVYLSECGTVYLVSFDVIREWQENGIMQTPDDVYDSDQFTKNDYQRLLLKFDKKSKILDLLTKVRRKRVIKNIKEINLYRLHYSRRDKLYVFDLVSPDDYNKDIFGNSKQNKNSAIFYICSNEDPQKPLL